VSSLILAGANLAQPTTVVGGATNLVAVLPLSGEVATARTYTVANLTNTPVATAYYTANPNTGISAILQPLPKAVTFNNIRASATVTGTSVPGNAIITLAATVYKVAVGTYTATATSLTCQLGQLGGSIAVNTYPCSSGSGSATFAAGDTGFTVVSATVTSGTDTASTVTMAVSVGLSQ
jgi:hypothetical protein